MDEAASIVPSPFEKLSLKFILDEIRERKTPQPEPEESQPAHQLSEPAMHELSEVSPIEARNRPDIPSDKKYFRIGEVSELLGVEPHVLRYWESEFRGVRPVKSRAGHRVYARKDVELLFRIQELLHVEKFSINGAKRALQKQRQSPVVPVIQSSKHINTLKDLASELRELLHTCRQW